MAKRQGSLVWNVSPCSRIPTQLKAGRLRQEIIQCGLHKNENQCIRGVESGFMLVTKEKRKEKRRKRTGVARFALAGQKA
jgi:hypothetical protein